MPRKTSAAETMRTVSRLANDSCCARVIPRELPVVAPRELERRELGLELSVHGAHIALVEPRGHREDGLLVLPPQFVRASHDPDRRELVERDKADPRSRGRARCWRGRRGRGHCETDGQPTQSRRVCREDAPGAPVLTGRCVVEDSTHPTTLTGFRQDVGIEQGLIHRGRAATAAPPGPSWRAQRPGRAIRHRRAGPRSIPAPESASPVAVAAGSSCSRPCAKWTRPSWISSSTWSVGAEAMADGSLRIPDRSYDDLRHIADRFLAEHHPDGGLPVSVEEIIEFRLVLNIIPMPGLRRFFDIDGYVSKSLRDISVDQYIQESRPDHYRYVLAHELSHVLIHGEIVSQFDFDSIEAWKVAIHGIPQGREIGLRRAGARPRHSDLGPD